MNEPTFGATMEIELRLIATHEGGRKTPILSGYRPNLIVKNGTGDDVILGLCVLELDSPLQPGAASQGRLRFGLAVSELARTLLTVGTEFSLSEAKWIVGTGRVLALTARA